jgi:hypothetical protein
VSAITARWGGGLGQAANAGPPLQAGLVGVGAQDRWPRPPPAWRMLKASMIWEKPGNNAKNLSQNKVR